MTEFWPGLEPWAESIERAAAQGVADGLRITEGVAQDTDAYVGVTGATRAGTYTYVPGVNDERFSEAVQAVVEHNPLHLDVQQADAPPEGVIRGVLSTPTDYQINLERDNAGARSWIPDAIYSTAPRVMQVVVGAIREVF